MYGCLVKRAFYVLLLALSLWAHRVLHILAAKIINKRRGLAYKAHAALPEKEREEDAHRLQLYLWRKGPYP